MLVDVMCLLGDGVGGCSDIGGCGVCDWNDVSGCVGVVSCCVVGDCGGVSGCSFRGGLSGVCSCVGDYVVVVLLVVVVWGN